jgi:hypothetical protein
MIFFAQFLPSRITYLRDDLAGLMKLPKQKGGNNQAKKLLFFFFFFFFFFCFFSKTVLQLLLPLDFRKRRRLPKSSSSSSDKFPAVHLYNTSWKKTFKQKITLKSTASVEHSENSFHNIVFFLFFFKSHDSLPPSLPPSLPQSFPKLLQLRRKLAKFFNTKELDREDEHLEMLNTLEFERIVTEKAPKDSSLSLSLSLSAQQVVGVGDGEVRA